MNTTKSITNITEIPSTTRVCIEVDTRLHEAMREIARRKRARIALQYDEAISLYLSKLDNYISKTVSAIVKRRLAG